MHKRNYLGVVCSFKMWKAIHAPKVKEKQKAAISLNSEDFLWTRHLFSWHRTLRRTLQEQKI